MALSRLEAKAFYDKFGAKQDKQAFYEDPAINCLIANARLKAAYRIFEFGFGTGRLAERLFREVLPPSASYAGVDCSPVMADLARGRLAPFVKRADVKVTDGSIEFPIPEASVDCVISTYVLDLLCEYDSRRFMENARRVLRPGGRLLLTSLTDGTGPVSRAVTGVWKMVYRLRPVLVGGCRPIQLTMLLEPTQWKILHREVVVSFGIASEVLVAVSAD